jgi:Fic family protein
VFHEIDLNMGGRMLGLKSVSERKRYKYVSRQLIEESIASAQLEGAHTTREAAQKMIREGRTPADLGQRMIYNNYRTMRLIEEELKDEPLTLEKLCELHDILTGGTLEKPDQAGRLRHEDEKITVSSEIDGKIAHIPPPVSFVKKEIKRLIAWANDELDEKNFIHPLIKAIALHFWIGYLHPFTDGNGRLARALFYWYMLRKGYWAFAFIPVSTRIKKSPKQYIEAYVYSEQDDCDLTYFIDYNIRQLELARKDFEEYLLNRESEGEKHKKLAKSMPELNDRQLQLMQYFLTHPNERTNVTSITRLYGVTPATAVKDLKTLEQKKLLTKKKQGRNMFYYSTGKLLGLSS